MENILLMKVSFVLLSLAALGGVVMAGIRFSQNMNPPSWLAMLHGLLAGAAATLLLFAYFTVGLPVLACWALLMLLIAAAGGVCLNLAYHAKLIPLPKPIVIVHGGLAVAAYVLLLMAVFFPR